MPKTIFAALLRLGGLVSSPVVDAEPINGGVLFRPASLNKADPQAWQKLLSFGFGAPQRTQNIVC